MSDRELTTPFATRVADNVRRQGHRFVCGDDVQEVYGGGKLIDKEAQQAIDAELREYGFEPA